MANTGFTNVLEKWFDSWATAFSQQLELRRALLEALSDSAPEQCINPLLASSFRRFGQRLAKAEAPTKCFWVRSEWEKVDISYGLAEPFDLWTDGWDKPWLSGTTGDLGMLEVKVCYADRHRGRATILAGQLRERREKELTRKRENVAPQCFHGLVWLFQHRGVDKLAKVATTIREEARSAGLSVVRDFEVPGATDDLGDIWPSLDHEPYTCGASLALLRLP